MAEYEAALAIFRATGGGVAALQTLDGLANSQWMEGELDRAIGSARDVLEQYRQSPFGDRVSRAYATANLFGMLVERGDLVEADALGRELLPELCELGITHGWSDHFASYLARIGNCDNAVRLVGWGDTLRRAKALKRQPNEQRARDTTLLLARQSGADVEKIGRGRRADQAGRPSTGGAGSMIVRIIATA